ncbi:uroporphyrinogen-III synthase [Novosphingobium flavum]|uniref:Uroporphyrinogen-III synthase n=1 Tax=Novosphingobium flavum TaxID=1778672 RepID=A0A7X1FRS8_9SPHN|nr:uroporphyrinogen-III synthase [Novosphingobium flavum]MBC2665649.1 uroporphyrinogen-III synthase [Novosphingobium flavum]
MIPLLAIRPEPGASATVAAARALGLEAEGFPLFSVRPVAWDLPDSGAFDLLLAGSANVFRHGGAGLAALRGLPIHAVGEATAEAAREAGFAVAAAGSGGLQGVLDQVRAGARVLRLAGAERVTLSLPAGVSMTERTVYESLSAPMPAALVRRLEGAAVVLLHSAEAARHFAAECGRHGVVRARLHLACIGPRVAAAAGSGWASVSTAQEPLENALLAKAAELCHT